MARVLEPGRLLRPLELVTLRGEPFESIKEELGLKPFLKAGYATMTHLMYMRDGNLLSGDTIVCLSPLA